jgi:hypothetical protein
MHELQLKAQEDQLVFSVINNIARYAIASLFYFELDSILERCNKEYISVSSIFCTIRQSDLAFKPLLEHFLPRQLSYYKGNRWSFLY